MTPDEKDVEVGADIRGIILLLKETSAKSRLRHFEKLKAIIVRTVSQLGCKNFSPVEGRDKSLPQRNFSS